MIITAFSTAKKNYNQLAPLFLRLVIGFGFIVHGWAKLSKGPAGFEKLLTLIGVPFPHIMSWVTALLELFGGLAILLGFFVSLTAIPLIIVMLVATFTIQIRFGFSSVRTIGLSQNGPLFGPPGYEINLLYIAGLVSLIFTGAGVFSVDGLMMKQKKTEDL
jgi:putative oxidoreductase